MQIMRLLSGVISLYSLVLLVRVLLSWLGGIYLGSFQTMLYAITEPYLAFFRRFRFLRLGMIDLSPVAALASLSVINRVLSILASQGNMRISSILLLVISLVIGAVWSLVSFVLGFSFVVVTLRLLGFLFNANNYHPIWRLIFSISEPILNSCTFFLNSKTTFVFRSCATLFILAALYFLLRFGVGALTLFL